MLKCRNVVSHVSFTWLFKYVSSAALSLPPGYWFWTRMNMTIICNSKGYNPITLPVSQLHNYFNMNE